MTVDELLAADPNGEYGYMCEAYITYLRELHETHQFLPMLPENRKVDISELSDYQRELHDGTSTPKLISSLNDKEAYVCHFRVLQQAASMGLKVTKIHRVIRFKQSAWLAPYKRQGRQAVQGCWKANGKGLYDGTLCKHSPNWGIAECKHDNYTK